MDKVASSSQSSLVKRLIEVGVMPERCTRFALRINVNEPITLITEQYVTEEQLEKVVAEIAADIPNSAEYECESTLIGEESGRCVQVRG
jgi:hypothetical protein